MGFRCEYNILWTQSVTHSNTPDICLIFAGTGLPPDMELFGYPAYGDFGTNKTEKGSMGTNTSLVTKSSHQNPNFCNWKACCEKTCHVLFGLLYFLTQLILVVIFALSACHPAFIVADTLKYRTNADMYTVNLEGHRPLAMFLKCRGQGNETLIYENGLGSEAYMAWHFIPRYLEEKYVVCVTDRRGYGWSETFEHDLVSLLADEDDQQWSKTNSEFFVKLVETAEIQTPFYYMGHSYGGHHIVQVALSHPEMVKGLFFLDSAGFGITEVFETYGELASNFEALGLMYILTESNWIDMGRVLDGVVEYSVIPSDIQKQVWILSQSRNNVVTVLFILMCYMLIKPTTLIKVGESPQNKLYFVSQSV